MALQKPLDLPPELAGRFARAPEPSVAIETSEPVPGIEALTWHDAGGEAHVTLRASGEPLTITVTGQGLKLPLTTSLPGATLSPKQSILANPGSTKDGVTFECPVGDSAQPLELTGHELADLNSGIQG